MKITVKTLLSILKTGLFILMAFVLVMNGEALAQEKKKSKKKKKKPEIAMSFRLGASYDDNILKYSEKYLDRFMNREDEGRFKIETYDDLIILTAFNGTLTHKFFKKRKTVFNIDAARRTYAVNDIKTWESYGIGVRQYLPKRISFKFLYSYIPEFYVRDFRDKYYADIYGYSDPRAYTSYIFSKDNYGFYIQKYFFKKTRLKFSVYYSPYYHNAEYNVYDSDNWMYGMDFYQPLFKKLRLELGYDWVTSDAKGYDERIVGETAESNHGPDASYVEDRFVVGLLWTLPKVMKKSHSFSAKLSIMDRFYVKNHPVEVDLLHAGRVDNNRRLYFTYSLRLNKSMSVKAFYNWLYRDTRTTSPINSEYVSDEKDYIQNVFGVEFSYKLKL